MSQGTNLRVSPLTINLQRHDLREMLWLVRILFKLSETPSYRGLVGPELPEIARFDPGHASLMMGYDFHLTADGPRLIEVNTNAGGAYIALLSERQSQQNLSGLKFERFEERLLETFYREWRDFKHDGQPLQSVAIIDEDPEQQALYEEMLACRGWLNESGIKTWITDPQALKVTAEGVFIYDQKVDFIYNRHCDFFLETDAMQDVRRAYLDGKVCLSPNPQAYGLLADKRRMISWSDPAVLDCLPLSAEEKKHLLKVVPGSRLLADLDEQQVWDDRNGYIFKPVASFGSRGVVMGKSVSRKRFAQLDPAETLVQEVIPPSVAEGADGQKFKTDVRLFVYRNRMLGIAARLYQGQVTNLRTEGGGFAPVRLV